ncbi:MAG: hypothetical protein AB7O78_05550 [Thermoleophilia bacterium]
MIRHAARGVPWGMVALACAIVPGLFAVIALDPDRMWPLQGIAVGLLAAAAAWCMDEDAAAVVDTLPRSLAWRTAARGLAVVPLAAVWAATLIAAAGFLPDHRDLFLRQGAAALLLGVAVATWLRWRGAATPGAAAGTGALAVVAVLSLVRPADDQVPLFPAWEGWARSGAIWWALLAAGAALLAWSLRPGVRRA